MLFLVFELGKDRYAIEASQVVEILHQVNFKQIPRAPAGVAGILDYHGAPVPLIDLSELALGRPSRKWMSTRIILVKYLAIADERRLLGLLAEQATETLRRGEEDFSGTGLEVSGAPYLGPVTADAEGIVQRIEIQRLLSEELRSQLFGERAGRT